MNKLLIGLGNPGRKYEKNRHNAGFLAIDEIAKKFLVTLKYDKKFSADKAFIDYEDSKVILAKPMDFMNNSGIAVQKLAKYYQVPINQIYVLHDELEVALGKVKTKVGGGAAGHNGLRSIIRNLGSEFCRIRIGIDRPTPNISVVDYVLRDFSNEELSIIAHAIDQIANNLNSFLAS